MQISFSSIKCQTLKADEAITAFGIKSLKYNNNIVHVFQI